MRLLVLLLAAGVALHAEVADSAANGFTIKSTWTVNAPPDVVYKNLMNVGDYWNPQHTFSGNAHNLSIEARVPGCFCEKLPNGGGVRHLEVVYLVPGKVIRLVGGLGPMQALAVNGSMTIQLAPVDPSSTKISLTYAVEGYMEKGLNTFAPMADAMLKEQFTRLKTFTETGSAVEAKK
jgi:hypothetical protein